MIDLENSIIPEKTIVIPSSINYPGIRILIPGTDISSKGDRVKITVNVVDKDGVDKALYSQKIVFKELPTGKNITGVVLASFTDTDM